MRVQNRYLPSAVHRLFNGLLALFVGAGLGVAGISFFPDESVLWSLSGWVLLLSPVLGLVFALVNPNRFSIVRGVAGDAGYDGLRQVGLLNVLGLSANNSFERTNTLRVFAAQLMIRQTTWSTMSAPRLLLLFLLLWVAALPVGVAAGWLAPVWVNRHFGASSEFWMLGAFIAAAVLMVWMVAHCISSSRLSRTQKNKWYGLLFVGGPITAGAYLWSELGPGGSKR